MIEDDWSRRGKMYVKQSTGHCLENNASFIGLSFIELSGLSPAVPGSHSPQWSPQPPWFCANLTPPPGCWWFSWNQICGWSLHHHPHHLHWCQHLLMYVLKINKISQFWIFIWEIYITPRPIQSWEDVMKKELLKFLIYIIFIYVVVLKVIFEAKTDNFA